jgi:hypothetical protein
MDFLISESLGSSFVTPTRIRLGVSDPGRARPGWHPVTVRKDFKFKCSILMVKYEQEI